MNNSSRLDLNSICLTEDQRRIIRGSIIVILQKYIFPVQFTLGISGNFLNLLVLLGRGMRTKTNIILASVAICDIGFLFSLFFNSLATFQPLYNSQAFVDFYYRSKNHLMGLANWFSAGSIWFVLTVTIERLVVIKFPLQAKFYWKPWKVATAILFIAVTSFGLTFYHHLSYNVRRIFLCNGTQSVYDMRAVTGLATASDSIKIYIRMSTVLSIAFIIVIPLIALSSLNFGLILVLKTQRRAMFGGKDCQNPDRRTSNPNRAKASERKVTGMVAAIVTTFTLTNVPSIVIFLWHYCHGFKIMPPLFYTIASLSNALVVTGKVLNFFLYCTSSAHFRQNLLKYFLNRNSKLGRLLITISEHNTTHYSLRHTHNTITTPATRSRRASSLISGESTPLRALTRPSSPVSQYRSGSRQHSVDFSLDTAHPRKRPSLVNSAGVTKYTNLPPFERHPQRDDPNTSNV